MVNLLWISPTLQPKLFSLVSPSVQLLVLQKIHTNVKVVITVMAAAGFRGEGGPMIQAKA